MARSLGGVGAWAEEAEREEAERLKAAAEAEAEAEVAPAAAISKSRRKKNPTYSISEVTTGQYVGPGGRSRALPDTRIFPFADRSMVSDQSSRGRGFDTRPQEFDRKREAFPVPASRADQVDDWGSVKRASAAGSAAAPRDQPHSNSDRRRFPSQDGKRTVESSSEETKQAELVQRQARVRSDPFAGARPREQVLADKEKEGQLDKDRISEKDKMYAAVKDGDKVSSVVEEQEEVIGEEKSRSSLSSRPPTPRGLELESQIVAPKKKVNPFGEAKPREVQLEQRGVDYRQIDLDLERRSAVRSELEKERELKEEIRELGNLLKNSNEGDYAKPVEGSGHKEHADNIQVQLIQKESELQELTLTLDDMVRFPQKLVDRPSSQSGRSDYSGKLASGSERSDISRVYNPERLGSLSLSGERVGEYDGERPGLGSRERDMSRRFEPERWGGPGFRSDRAGFIAASDSGWTGTRLGYNDRFQGNGSERPRSNSGHFNVNRGHPIERQDSHSQRNNIPRVYDSVRPSSGSRHSDARGYGSERSGLGSRHDDTRTYETERPGAGSWQGDARWYESAGPRPNSRSNDMLRGLAPERPVPLPARENTFREGSDFERPVNFGGGNERKKSVFERLGPIPAQRELPRGYNVGRLGSRPDSVDTYGEVSAVDWQFGNEDNVRFHQVRGSSTAHERDTMEPWLAQADIRRGYDRGSERSSNDQFMYKGSTYDEDFNRRRNYRQQGNDRRGHYVVQNKFGQGKGVHVDHR
ncbi:hypothetical protein KI387_034770 [Taxus chinensis]|uniref:Uncharacterized protein n=1 Tax=Taxus chinensis TaxID=29808 RepID=A0AA38C1B2_TAXCH|nr:hypothetical protein KI387_034770 [Taxus chinensis]